MTRKWHVLLASGAALVVGACSEGVTEAGQGSYDLSAAFVTLPAGYGDVASSYVGTVAGGGTPWLATGGRERASLGMDAMMGGGLGDAFVGGIAFGHGFGGHHGPFAGVLDCTGTFANGRVTCAPVTRNGLTIERSAAFTDAQGNVQQAFDTATTNTANLRISVTGTLAFAGDSGRGGPGFGFGPRGGHRGRGGKHGSGGRGGLLLGDTATVLSATTTVSSASDRTVSGLAQGSTQRTVNGTSRSEESTTGTSSRGAFTTSRAVGDTTQGLVVPVPSSGSVAYPTAGTVIRAMRATVTYAGEAATTQSRREVVTYDGSSTAKVVITQDGETRNCTRPLPRGRLVCE